MLTGNFSFAILLVGIAQLFVMLRKNKKDKKDKKDKKEKNE